MGRRCQVLKEWLERSGSCFLSLFISYPRSNSFGADTESHSKGYIHGNNSNPCAVHSTVAALDLSMPFSVYRQLQARIPSKAMLSNLRTLRVATNPEERLLDGSVAPPLLVLEAPNLRTLSLNASSLTRKSRKLLPTNAWGLLTDLCFNSPVDDIDIPILLQACPCLVNCQIQVTSPIDTPPPRVEVCLPHPEKLKIFECSRPSSPALRSIMTPSLTFFQYQSPERPFHISGVDENMKWFIGNSSSTLKKLRINPTSFRREIALPFQLAVSLTHLPIGWFPRAHLFDEPPTVIYLCHFYYPAPFPSILLVK